MERIVFRWLQPNDCEVLIKFINKLKDSEGLGFSSKLTEEDLKRDGFSNPPCFYCLIAEENKVIKGYCMFCSMYDSDYGRKLFIEDLYVDDELIKHGIGSTFLRIVCQFGRKRGYSKMSLIRLGFNENFYTKIGFQNDTKVVGYEWYSKEISRENDELQDLNNNLKLDLL